MTKCPYDGAWCHYCLHGGCEYFPYQQRKSFDRRPMLVERKYQLIYGTGRKMAQFVRTLGARYRRTNYERIDKARLAAKDT